MSKPLALKMAPESLNDVIGQKHLIGDGKIISNLVKNKKLFSMILYGKPGIGKTSIANALIKDMGVSPDMVFGAAESCIVPFEDYCKFTYAIQVFLS